MRKAVVVKPELVVYFGLLLFKSEFGVSESEKRVAAIFLLPVWPLKPPAVFCLILPVLSRVAHRQLEMLSIRKPGVPN